MAKTGRRTPARTAGISPATGVTPPALRSLHSSRREAPPRSAACAPGTLSTLISRMIFFGKWQSRCAVSSQTGEPLVPAGLSTIKTYMRRERGTRLVCLHLHGTHSGSGPRAPSPSEIPSHKLQYSQIAARPRPRVIFFMLGAYHWHRLPNRRIKASHGNYVYTPETRF